MIIPIYDIATLPTLTYDMKCIHRESTRYLGGIAITGAVEVEVATKTATRAEALALYNFWKNTCNFGLEPFLIPLNIFGADILAVDKPDLLVAFLGDFEPNLSGAVWDQRLRLRVLGTIDYIVDELGNFIVSDTGEYTVTAGGDYVPTGNIINSYREVLYGN